MHTWLLLLPLLITSTAEQKNEVNPPVSKTPSPQRELSGGGAVILAALIDGQKLPQNGSHATELRCVIENNPKACRRAKPATFTVEAAQISCAESNIAVGEFTCQITASGEENAPPPKQVTGHLAFEFLSALRAAGVESEGTAGHLQTAAKDVSCTMEMKALLERGGGGAKCTLTATSNTGEGEPQR